MRSPRPTKSDAVRRGSDDGDMGLVVDTHGRLHTVHDLELAMHRSCCVVQRSPDERRASVVITRNWPFVTLALFLLIWAIYIAGNMEIDKQHDASSTEPWEERISPANKQWWFFAYSPWPQCTDLRHEAWRLFSLQFTHAGIQHILGNTLCGLIFGGVLEVYHPMGHALVLLVFQSSVCLGTLGFTLLWPYSGLIGASPGVYGLFGAAWSLCLFEFAYLDKFTQCVLPFVLITQFVADVTLFFVQYSSTVGYASHFFGGVAGFLAWTACLTFSPRHTTSHVRRGFSLTAIALWLALTVCLAMHYLVVAPPQPVTWSYARNEAQSDCCAGLFAFLDEHESLSRESVMRSSICVQDEFRYYGGTTQHAFSAENMVSQSSHAAPRPRVLQ